MKGRFGNDALRAVALLGGLLVAGALLLTTADTRVAQFTFEARALGAAGPEEPVSLALDARPPGTVYVSGSAAGAGPARAGDVTRVPAGGDLAVDGNGNVFLLESRSSRLHLRAVEEGRPTEGTAVPSGAGSHSSAVAREDGLLVLSAVRGGGLHVWTSSDGGRTVRGPTLVRDEIGSAGPVIVGPFGSLFAAVVTTDGKLGVVASADGGETWSARGVTMVKGVSHEDGRNVPALAIDDAATLYVAVTLGTGDKAQVAIAHSRDVGLTWSRPVRATPPGAGMPQLVAGSLGKVGLAYVHHGELVYRWTNEALLRQPFWTEHLVTPSLDCPPCVGRPYELALTGESKALLVTRSRGSLVVVRQTSGAGVR